MNLAKLVIGTLLLMSLSAAHAGTVAPKVVLKHLTGPIYVVEDYFYARENSVVYVGPKTVTVVGATWTPETAKLLAGEIARVTKEPVATVVNTDYHPDRTGGNAYWKRIGAKIVATRMTYDLMQTGWTKVCDFVRKYFPDFPQFPATLPTVTHRGDFTLQRGRIRALYFGPSHTPDGIFVYFPKEKVLYAGSILKEHLGDMVFAAPVAEYEKTLEKLKARHLAITTIISGHWSAVHGPELVDQYLGFLRDYSTNGH